MDIPAKIYLEAAIGQDFRLSDSADQSVPAKLTEVTAGIAMSHEYECYSAFFKLPQGTRIGAGTFWLQDNIGQRWLLQANPIRPQADGLPMIEILFHVMKKNREEAA